MTALATDRIIGVVGAGTMGGGIAQLAAAAGHPVLLFDAFEGRIFSGMEQPNSKPAPDVYLAAAASLGIDPAEAAVIEDSPTGVIAGAAAGSRVLGFCPDSPVHQTAETLLAAGAAETFSAMDQLPGLLAE